MVIIWMVTLLNLAVGYILKDIFLNNIYLTFIYITVITFILFLYVAKKYTRFMFIIFSSFIIRILFLIIDLRYRNLFSIPHSGNDTENFYNTGITISQNLFMLAESTYGGIYSKFLGVLFYIYGDERVFIQFLNILFALTAILISVKILKKLEVSSRFQTIAVLIMAFFPHSIIFSSILLRESLISMLIVISLYFFIKWFKKGNFINALISVLVILSASALHSAVIGIVIGYIFAFIFYKRSIAKFTFSIQTVIPFTLFTLLFLYALVFPESLSKIPIFNKFTSSLDDGDTIYDIASGSDRGGSAYLTGLEINNIFQLLVFAPIKLLYFIASPLPWDIRNFNDLFSFGFDVIFYITVFILIVCNIKIIKRKPLLIILILSLLACIFILGVGVSNTGTALRHRFKLFYLMIVTLSVLLTYKIRN